jgi:simple sugar transport system substrate-binding protein
VYEAKDMDSGGTVNGTGFNRRDFLKAGGAGLVGAVMLGAVGCGGQSEQGGNAQTQGGGGGLVDRSDIRIVMVTHGAASDPYWSVAKNGVDQAAADLGVTAEYRAPNTFDIAQVQRILESAVASQPNGLAVTIVDESALGDPIREATDSGIPVVVLDTGEDAWQDVGALTYLGQSEYNAGVDAGKRMAQEGVGTALCINHEQGNVALTQRCDGFKEGLGGEVKEIAISGTNPTSAQNSIETALRQNSDADGMLTLGPPSALPALKALQEGDTSNDFMFATFDLSPEILRAISDDKILFSIETQPFLQGYLSVLFLTTYNQYGLRPVGEVLTGPNFVTKENVEDVNELTKQGIR